MGTPDPLQWAADRHVAHILDMKLLDMKLVNMKLVDMKPRTKPRPERDSRRQTDRCAERPRPQGGFTLIELMIVTVIIALLAAIAIPQFDGIRQRAYNTAALADLNNANKEIERFFNDFYRYPDDDDELIAQGYSHTPGVAFTTFSIRDEGDPDERVHMHIDHEGSLQYYHYEYPKGYSGVPELRWK